MDDEIIAYLKKSREGKDDWEYWYKIYLNSESESFNKAVKKNASKMFSKPKTSYLWLTLSPDKLLRNMDNTPENLEALNKWASNWFENYLGYGDYAWVAENGSEGDHLHIHCVLEMKNSHKHAEKLKRSWNKHFPNNQLLTSVDCSTKAYRNGTKRGEYCYLRFDDPAILHDKLTYMNNEMKASHENLCDTGVRGSRGFLTDNINETPLNSL